MKYQGFLRNTRKKLERSDFMSIKAKDIIKYMEELALSVLRRIMTMSDCWLEAGRVLLKEFLCVSMWLRKLWMRLWQKSWF